MIVSVYASASLCVCWTLFLNICLFLSYLGLFALFYLILLLLTFFFRCFFFLMREIPKDVYFSVWVDGEDLAEFGEGGAIM